MNNRICLLLMFVAVASSSLVLPREAFCLPPFLARFQAKYAEKDSADDSAKKLAELVASTKCNVCHMKGKPKKQRNPYGAQLALLLDKDNFKKERLEQQPDEAHAEIDAALDKVAGLRPNPQDDKSPTFGELLAAAKLPYAPAAAVTVQKPKPSPSPTPEPIVTEPVAAVNEQVAIDMVYQYGGSMYPLARDDDRRSVDFHLQGTGLNDAGLSYVKSIPRLAHLHLKDTQITDAGLAHLAGVVTLTRLHLEKTKVTDAGLPYLQHLPKLEYLNLYGTEVSDEGLQSLARLPSLKKLYLWQTKCTLAGVEQFQQAHPDVHVSFPELEEQLRKLRETKRKQEEQAKQQEEEAKPKEEAA